MSVRVIVIALMSVKIQWQVNRTFLLEFFMSISRRSLLITTATLSITTAMLWVTPANAAPAPHVSLQTSAGEIVLELNPEKAPKTVDNFIQYVKSGQYAGTIFHRVIDGFMIQGGGFDSNMTQKPTHGSIVNESKNGLVNAPYTIAMARTNDPDSANAQFFINVGNNVSLNYTPQNDGYCVFGKVIRGMDVVDKIKQTSTSNRGMYQNVPTTPIVIQKATVVP
jgi:cyclophilin family peptidyl-prolyl cis-trans isomerase